ASWHFQSADELRARSAFNLKAWRLPDPRPTRGRAQEIRQGQSPPFLPVLEAVTLRSTVPGCHPVMLRVHRRLHPIRRQRSVCLDLRPRGADFLLGAEDVAVQVRDPLASSCSDVEVMNGGLNVGVDAAPVELRIMIDHICGRAVTQLPIQPDLFEFVKKRIRFTNVMRIAKLSDEIGSAQ